MCAYMRACVDYQCPYFSVFKVNPLRLGSHLSLVLPQPSRCGLSIHLCWHIDQLCLRRSWAGSHVGKSSQEQYPCSLQKTIILILWLLHALLL